MASDFENLNHVEELPVNVTDHGDGRLDVDDIALFHQQLFRFGAYRFNDGLGEELLVVQSGYAFVEIYTGCSARRRRRQRRLLGEAVVETAGSLRSTLTWKSRHCLSARSETAQTSDGGSMGRAKRKGHTPAIVVIQAWQE
jgi:hypothetical protein